MSAAEERRKVLEEKKAKLAEMKRARDERMAAANQPQKTPSRGPVSLSAIGTYGVVIDLDQRAGPSDTAWWSETRGR